MSGKQLKVAVAHYWFVSNRGGEKVVESILKIFPQADVYTLFYDETVCGDMLAGHQVYSSCLDLPWLRRHYQKLFPLYPIAVRSLKLQEKYDLLISSESGPIKGIVNHDNIPHICYIHSPMRYCWGYTEEYLRGFPWCLRHLLSFLFNRLREYDQTTIAGVDYFIANSKNIAQRVKKYYGREADVCYPPINESLFAPGIVEKRQQTAGQRDYYLSFGALVPYKRVDLLVQSFAGTGRKLVIIGEGSEREKLAVNATENISFKGALPWKEIQPLILGAKALIFPGEEDFGMIPLEVMAYGVPVIAFGKGGALETVVAQGERLTGLFFEEQTVPALYEALNVFEAQEDQYYPGHIIQHSAMFREDVFLQRMRVLLGHTGVV